MPSVLLRKQRNTPPGAMHNPDLLVGRAGSTLIDPEVQRAMHALFASAHPRLNHSRRRGIDLLVLGFRLGDERAGEGEDHGGHLRGSELPQSVYFGFSGMRENHPTLAGLEQVLELIASDPRIPPNFRDWIRGSIRSGGGKNQVLRYILDRAPCGGTPPRVLDVGAQFGSLAVYAMKLGCRAAAVDYGPAAKHFQKVAADHGVDYQECDAGAEPLPFSDNQFDFVTYTDVMEHHSFSPKRVLREIHRVLVPGGQVILVTPNHASLYNRLKLVLGGSVNDDFDYFFDLCADERIYAGHHREYTRTELTAALRRTQFRVRECRIFEQDLTSLMYYLRRHRTTAEVLPESRDLLLSALGKIWALLHLPLGRWIWAVGEKTSGGNS